MLEHDIFKVRATLWEHPCGYLSATSYAFPFEIQLGDYNYPSSLESLNGFIRYKLKATIERPAKFGHTTAVPMTLLSSIPKFHPDFTEPQTYTNENTYGVMTRETIKLITDTTFRTSCPGGDICLDLAFAPVNTKSITGLDIKLIQVITLLGLEKETQICNPVSQIQFNSIEELDLIRVPVPEEISPSIFTSKVLRVTYKVAVSASVAWSRVPLLVEIPIQISTLNVTLDELPHLLSVGEYLDPLLLAGDTNYDEVEILEDISDILAPRSRLSLTPSLCSDLSSVFTNDSDEMDRRRTILMSHSSVKLPDVPGKSGYRVSNTQLQSSLCL